MFKFYFRGAFLPLFFSAWLLLCYGGAAYAENDEVADAEKVFTMAWGLQPTSLDPQDKVSLSANLTLLSHIFEPLFTVDENGHVTPVLVDQFEVEDPLTWLFTLKQGIKFHDGSELTSQNVLITFQRLKSRHEDNDFRKFIGEGVNFFPVDRYRFRVHTKHPQPDFLKRLIWLFIFNKKAQAPKVDLAQASDLVGTGPYRLVKWGEDLKSFNFEVFEDYHGVRPELKRVKAIVVNDETERLAGLQSGHFQLIDSVTSSNLKILRGQPNMRFVGSKGTKLYYMALDQYRAQSLDISNHKGQVLKHNPLKDIRVRQALSLAIDREALVNQFYGRAGAIQSGQLVPEGFPGYRPRLFPEEQDLSRARKLLQEAGYSQGFRLVLRDKDARRPVLESIASMLSQVNIQVIIQTLPPEQYFPRLFKKEFSAGLSAYEAYGSVFDMINDMLLKEGAANAGRYYNLGVEQRFYNAQQLFDTEQRNRAYGYIVDLAMADKALVPLYFIKDIWVHQRGVVFMPAGRPYTLAQNIKLDPIQVSSGQTGE